MDVTQISHHDLDGYGACIVAGYIADVKRVVHVARYSDVGAVLQTESERLTKASASELLLVTDLSLEPAAVQFIMYFAAANLKRPEERRHQLVILDHHGSSMECLSAKGLKPLPTIEVGAPSVYDVGDPLVHVAIDLNRCATRMLFGDRHLIAGRAIAPDLEERLITLVAAIDAYDLWRKSDPAFRQGVLINEVLWESASAYVPPGHPWHDRFVGDLLMAIAAELQTGASPSKIELIAPALRKGVVDALLSDEPDDDRSLTMRARLYAALSRSQALFRTLSDGTKLSFGLDGGVFQAVSDQIMERGDATRIRPDTEPGKRHPEACEECILYAVLRPTRCARA